MPDGGGVRTPGSIWIKGRKVSSGDGAFAASPVLAFTFRHCAGQGVAVVPGYGVNLGGGWGTLVTGSELYPGTRTKGTGAASLAVSPLKPSTRPTSPA